MYVNLILEISTSFVNDLHIHTFVGFVTAAAATAAPAVFTWQSSSQQSVCRSSPPSHGITFTCHSSAFPQDDDDHIMPRDVLTTSFGNVMVAA